MTAAKIAAVPGMSDEEIAENIAVDIVGLWNDAGWRWRDADGHERFWVDRGTTQDEEWMEVWSPATTPAQAMELARERLRGYELRWGDDGVGVYRVIREKFVAVHRREVVSWIYWTDRDHADLSAICEAVLVAHYEGEVT